MGAKDKNTGKGFDYDRAGYTKGEAQSRFDKQAEFCAKGGTPPWKGDGTWKDSKGQTVGDPAGPWRNGH